MKSPRLRIFAKRLRITVATLLILFSTKAPAPPPPDKTCTDGIPAAIVFAYDEGGGGYGYPDSLMRVPAVKVVDASGNSLRNVTLTFTMQPYLPGTPDGSFAHFTDTGDLVLDTTRVSQANSGVACSPMSPSAVVANDVLGLWYMTMSTGSGPSRDLQMAIVPADPIAGFNESGGGIDYAGPGIPFAMTHTVEVSPPIGGLNVHFSVPSTGASGRFASGATTASALTDALGRASMPTLIANAVPGEFAVTATVANKAGEPDVPPLPIGPFIVGGTSSTRLLPLEATTVEFGHSVNFQGYVGLQGLPRPAFQFDGSAPPPVGSGTLFADGNLFAGNITFQNPYYFCETCVDTEYLLTIPLIDLPFGTHSYQLKYDGEGIYANSASAPLVLTVNPNATVVTANGSTNEIGLLDNPCKVGTFAWQATVADAGYPADLQFPFGAMRYGLSNCASRDGFGRSILAAPTLVLQFDQVLPPDTVFMAYGPTAGASASTWHDVPSRAIGNRLYVMLRDGGLGDDIAGKDDVLTGIGGPAFTLDGPDVVDVIEYYNAGLDHYFMTASQYEAGILDNGIIAGWSRTGASFSAHAMPFATGSAVCRFYIPPAQGNSHFYSAFPVECAAAHVRFPTFVEESPAAFYIAQPSASGACQSGTVPVYRVWNQRPDSNHRYTTSLAVRDEMVLRGYVAEGFGPDSVAMCAVAPAASRRTPT